MLDGPGSEVDTREQGAGLRKALVVGAKADAYLKYSLA